MTFGYAIGCAVIAYCFVAYRKSPVLKLDLFPFQLRFKHPFKIAHGVRTTTDVVYIRLTHQNLVAWGEAALPPYLPETQKSVIDFFSKIDISGIQFPLNPVQIFKETDEKYSGNLSAKAALDMALWGLKAQIENKPIGELLKIEATQFPLCTYTLGVSSLDEMKVKVGEANQYGFELFKVKLNGENDKQALENFRRLTRKPFAIDVNQGWKTADEARGNLHDLVQFDPVLVEQPLPVTGLNEMPELLKEFSVPFYADESCRQPGDIEKLPGYFNGVNIKLMKCGGISPALEMIAKARGLGLKILIGCMSESSVGCTAAAHLTPLADYADLDGPYLIVNDPFSGMTVERGRIKVNPLIQKTAF